MKNDHFDYIIVGAGSAGSVLANRLSADPAIRVALIEAGPSDRTFPANLKTIMPVGNIFLLPDDKYNWKNELSYETDGHERLIDYPRGKILGGCSSINGSVYIRGQRQDYDSWAAAGNVGWSYADILPAFRQMENYAGTANRFHGTSGELDVGKPKSVNPLTHAFLASAIQAGHRQNDDFAADLQDGFGIYDLNQRNGTRLSSARAFLRPASGRENLTIFTSCLVRRVCLERGRATSVEVEQGGRRRVLSGAVEIILSAGAINSPHLLMLSGIGPEDELRRFDIPVQQSLPGVGKNLQDHPSVRIAMENPTRESFALSARSLGSVLASPFRYLMSRDGMLASNVAEGGGFLRVEEGASRPDVQLTFFVGLKKNAVAIPSTHGYMMLVQILRPRSSGAVSLRSSRPEDKPFISANFFEDPVDMAKMISGVREARRIIARPDLVAMSGKELEPGEAFQSDAQLADWIKRTVSTAYHACGTCKMGPSDDPMAVVDEQLRVRGVAGLRVVDASIMPSIVSGNTSAPAMMIAQRASELILGEVEGVAPGRFRASTEGMPL